VPATRTKKKKQDSGESDLARKLLFGCAVGALHKSKEQYRRYVDLTEDSTLYSRLLSLFQAAGLQDMVLEILQIERSHSGVSTDRRQEARRRSERACEDTSRADTSRLRDLACSKCSCGRLADQVGICPTCRRPFQNHPQEGRRILRVLTLLERPIAKVGPRSEVKSSYSRQIDSAFLARPFQAHATRVPPSPGN
jgi:hypothetical protein